MRIRHLDSLEILFSLSDYDWLHLDTKFLDSELSEHTEVSTGSHCVIHADCLVCQIGIR